MSCHTHTQKHQSGQNHQTNSNPDWNHSTNTSTIQHPKTVWPQPQKHRLQSASEINGYNIINVHQLKHQVATPIIRAKIMEWLIKESKQTKLSRHVCCLAKHYIDLYIVRKGTINLDNIHSLALASLLLANKLLDNKYIEVDHKNFPIEELIKQEIALCRQLSFKLHPHTYISMAEELIVQWNTYAKKRNDLWLYSLGTQVINQSQQIGSQKLFQLLDFMFMGIRLFNQVTKTYTFSMESIVTETFNLISEQCFDKKNLVSIEDEVIINFWNNPEVKQQSTSAQIINKFYKESTNNISFKIDRNRSAYCYITDLATYFEQSNSNIPYGVQTYHPSWFKSASSFMTNQKKNYRKESSDTTI